MANYKIYVSDRVYSSWEIFDTIHFQKIVLNDLNPVEEKLFSNDVFTLDEMNHNKVKLLHSSIRSETSIPGVLILSGNKTYGRENSTKPGFGKLLYKCIPDDMRLPSFLIPYQMKQMGFSKNFKNIYVTFTFNEWTGKHPTAKLDNVIGSVDILNNYYEYQLYCKSLNASIQKFHKETNKALENISSEIVIERIKEKYPSIQDRIDWHVITIDPPKSQDFDDGFSIIDVNDDIQQISIYISNVSVWLDYLQLWDSFSRRISTIYLPDKKRPMLPTILSDCLCSLQEKTVRIAFVMDIFIKKDTCEITDIQYSNCFIKVFKNYCYEEKELIANKLYQRLFAVTHVLCSKNRYIQNVRNSHEMVCYLMIFMNHYCAIELIKHNTGIFRATINTSKKREIVTSDKIIPEEVQKFIQIWTSSTGQYIDVSGNTRHETLDLDAYIHITSPIRRLVDLLNIIQFQQSAGIIQLSENAAGFYKKWLNDLDYINTTMRNIRKLQCDCNLLDLCFNNPHIMEKEYDGYLFDKISRNDGLHQFVVYLPDIKLTSRITTRENFENFDCTKCKLILFQDEENFKRKIRLQML
jgi:exoribonuclease R